MEILGKILGSQSRVKIMRLFLQNKDTVFQSKEIVARSRVGAEALRRELNLLRSVNFIKKNTKGYFFNSGFKYTREFEVLLIGAEHFDDGDISNNFKNTGKLKLLIVSGYFIKNKDSRVDVLVVGDTLKRSKIEEGIKKLEAELGTELTYAIFDTQEFLYRLNMYDKLVRDILDFPHKVLLQAKELSPQVLKGSK
jgi:hypothetical protein